ncbi:MAG: leucine-rich repeat protein [Bacillota bacterium]|nr:leucine-rich repeat protein [Bacillota bacterium]
MKKTLAFILVLAMVLSVCVSAPLNIQAEGNTITLQYGDVITVGQDAVISNEALTTAGEALADTEVLSYNEGKIYAVGLGTATLNYGGSEYAVTVEPANIALVLVAGQSNAAGDSSDYTKAVSATGDYEGKFFVTNTMNSSVTTAEVNLETAKATAENGGKSPNATGSWTSWASGPATALAAELSDQWDEKIWVVNAAMCAQIIERYDPSNADHYAYTKAVNYMAAASAALEADGHYVIDTGKTGYFWLQGESNGIGTTAEMSMATYMQCYLNMHNGFKADFGANYGAVWLVRAGVNSNTANDYYMSGPRLAQLYMANSSAADYADIYLALNTDVWRTDAGVASYFAARYDATEFAARFGYTMPTTLNEIKPGLHHSQAGYNELGCEGARNIAAILNGSTQVTDAKLYDYYGNAASDTIELTTADTSAVFVPIASSTVYNGSAGITVSTSDASVATYNNDTYTLSVAGVGETTIGIYSGQTLLKQYTLTIVSEDFNISGNMWYTKYTTQPTTGTYITRVVSGTTYYFQQKEGINWSLSGARDNLTLTLSTNGSITRTMDYTHPTIAPHPSCDAEIGRPWYQYETMTGYSIKHVVVNEGITYVGNGLFSSMPDVEDITIPSTVTEIRWIAMYVMPSLKELTIKGGTAASPTFMNANNIYGCPKLEKVTLGKYVTTTTSNADSFKSCSANYVVYGYGAGYLGTPPTSRLWLTTDFLNKKASGGTTGTFVDLAAQALVEGKEFTVASANAQTSDALKAATQTQISQLSGFPTGVTANVTVVGFNKATDGTSVYDNWGTNGSATMLVTLTYANGVTLNANATAVITAKVFDTSIIAGGNSWHYSRVSADASRTVGYTADGNYQSTYGYTYKDVGPIWKITGTADDATLTISSNPSSSNNMPTYSDIGVACYATNGNGIMTAKDPKVGRPWCSYESTCKIKHIVIDEGITYVGGRMFSSMTNVVDATIPSTVTSYGWGSFYAETGLKKVTIADAATYNRIGSCCFDGGISLTEIHFGNNVYVTGGTSAGSLQALTGIKSGTIVYAYNNASYTNSSPFAEDLKVIDFIKERCATGYKIVDLTVAEKVENSDLTVTVFTDTSNAQLTLKGKLAELTASDNVTIDGVEITSQIGTEYSYKATLNFDGFLYYVNAQATVRECASIEAATGEVEALITAIGTVTPDSKAAIDAAREAYNALPTDIQSYVTNYSTLTAAESTYSEIVVNYLLAGISDGGSTTATFTLNVNSTVASIVHENGTTVPSSKYTYADGVLTLAREAVYNVNHEAGASNYTVTFADQTVKAIRVNISYHWYTLAGVTVNSTGYTADEYLAAATWKTAASSILSSPVRLFDGDLTTTYWNTYYVYSGGAFTTKDQNPHSVFVDFGEEKTISGLVSYGRPNDSVTGTPTTISVYGSNDNENYELIKTQDYQLNYDNRIMEFGRNVTYRYIKFVVVMGNGGFAQVMDLHFYLPLLNAENVSVGKNSGSTVSFGAGSAASVKSVTVDGVASANYSLANGNLTLSASAVSALSLGEHNVYAVYNNARAYYTITIKRDATDVVNAINAIGDVTLDSKAAIEAAEGAYNSLTEAEKAAVSNYATLTSARSTYDGLVAAAGALEQAKNAAVLELNGYKTDVFYRTSQKAAVLEDRMSGATTIKAATTLAEVQTALANAKTAIDAYKSDAELTHEEDLAGYAVNIAPTTGGNVYVGTSGTPTMGTQTATTGSTMELRAQPEANAHFKYWIDASTKRILSETDAYQMSVYSKKNIMAIFADNSNPDQYFVTFRDRSNKLVSYSYIAKSGSAESIAPTADKMYSQGYNFTGWNMDYTNVIGNLDVLAKYEKKDLNYTVTVANGTGSGTYAYDTRIIVTANAPSDGYVFAGWEVGSNIVSYEPSYTFFVSGDMTITATYAQSVVAKPTITMEVTTGVSGSYKIAGFQTTRSIPASGYTFVESGIIYVKAQATANDLVLANVGGLVSGKTIKVSTSTSDEGNGQYSLNASYTEMGITAVGFITYLDGSGNKVTVYTGANNVTGGYIIDKQSVRFVGRYYIGNADQLYYSSLTASGIEFSFKGTGADIELVSNHQGNKSDTYIHVFVDGNETLTTDCRDDSRILLPEGKSKITVAKDLNYGNHTVKILKSNEDRYNQVGWSAVYTDGELLSPPAARTRKIQVFGDSVASGCNNVNYPDNNDASTLGTPYQDGLLSYGSFVGRHFDADVEFFCCSGLASYSVFNTASANTSYDYVAPFSGNYNLWDHTSFEPDLIIQNTWVNDNNELSVYGHTPEELYPTYLRMFRDLREAHPNSKILIISSTTTTVLNEQIEKVINDLKTDGENNITLFKTSIPFTRHPLADKHQQMAEELYPVIENLMGWQ